MNDERIDALTVSPLDKGVSPRIGAVRLADLGASRLNLLQDDIPTPVAVLKQSALDSNSAWTKGFLKASGASIAPHTWWAFTRKEPPDQAIRRILKEWISAVC